MLSLKGQRIDISAWLSEWFRVDGAKAYLENRQGHRRLSQGIEVQIPERKASNQQDVVKGSPCRPRPEHREIALTQPMGLDIAPETWETKGIAQGMSRDGSEQRSRAQKYKGSIHAEGVRVQKLKG